MKMGEHFLMVGVARQIMSTHPPSTEQAAIISAISDTPTDVIIRVSAVAGSGKTTTALHIAKAYPDRDILLLTYNRHLSDENMKKAVDAGVTNITMKTFHSFAGKYFGRVVHDDVVIIRCLAARSGVHVELPRYDIIILDEFQDTTKPLFDFDVRLMQSYSSARFIVLGDPRQCIYQYNGATHQYMTLLGQLTGREIIDRTLSTTYRVPSGVANFVNLSLNRGEYSRDLVPFNEGQKPIFKIAPNGYAGVDYTVKFIHAAISSGEYLPSDVFILAASAKLKLKHGKKDATAATGAAAIANRLSEMGHLVFIDVDGFSADNECTEQKIVVSSIHKSKGRERKIVVVVGFDESYLKYYKRDYMTFASSRNDLGHIVAPNEMYVACTRASEILVLVATSGPAPFIARDTILDTTINNPAEIERHLSMGIEDDEGGYSVTSVTDLIASMPSIIKHTLLEETISYETYQGDTSLGVAGCGIFKATRLASKSSQTTKAGVDYVEQVADINGVASTLEASQQEWMMGEVRSAFYDETKGKGLTPGNLLTTAVAIQSTFRNHQYRRSQISTEEWVPKEKLFSLGTRIRARLPVDKAEVGMTLLDWRGTATDEKPSGCVDALNARFDLMYGDDVYEIKTTTTTKTDHILQVAVYRWMLDVAGDHVSTDDVAVFGCRDVALQLIAEPAYLRRSSKVWQWMRDGEECDLADDDDTAIASVTQRRAKRDKSRRWVGKMVTFLTSPKGRKRRFGAYRPIGDTKEYMIVDTDGVSYSLDDVYDPREVSREVPSPDGRTLVYNCLLDETTEVTITNPTLFDTLIRSKAFVMSDDEFIRRQKSCEDD